ncbi:H-NS histone family protein [Marichromatium gracile]|uniref:H-NS histone family protein n=1 Tax=Marichromatium gracile TaxID=1048 RepID=UPI001F24C617|nr:H-NS histone family protein [Marichromatium gracile]MCF1182880.1 H-NS histone family protein [Marichromatium gracile]
MEYANLSVEEIRRQLEEAESKQSELKRALEIRRREAKKEVAQEVRDLIQQRGYDLAEIVELLDGKKSRRTGVRKSSGSRQYTEYFDPENPENVYVRGVLPRWMKDKMTEKGLDHSSKEDRDTFKKTYLQVKNG